MTRRTWKIRTADRDDVVRLAHSLSISPLTATVLLARGVQRVDDAQEWLSPPNTVFHDPFLISDMDRAVDRLLLAVKDRERICCYGDYDVDGISATSLYRLFLGQRGANVVAYIPDRQIEGYGLNESALRKLCYDGVKVLLTADCGNHFTPRGRVSQ